jgi:SAM-dependent methyltransferase
MEEVLPKIDNLFDFLSIHQEMLADKIRVNAYQSAIAQTVKPGDIVIDIGAGTGLLSFFSIIAGAKRVYAIESRSIIKVAKENAKKNGWQDKIVFIHEDSRNIKLKEKCDVIVSEIMGHCLIDENMLDSIIDAKSRFLKNKGKIIPEKATIIFAPCKNQDFPNDITFWKNKIKGIDLSGALNRLANTLYVSKISRNDLLAKPKPCKEFDFYRMGEVVIDWESDFVINKDGVLHGIAGWFDISLNTNERIRIGTGPFDPTTHWKLAFFPIKESIKIRKKDLVRFYCKCYSTGLSTVWEWIVEVKRENKKIYKTLQSTELY